VIHKPSHPGPSRRRSRCPAACAAWLGGLLAALCTPCCRAADWPQWRGADHNGLTSEQSGWPAGWPPKKLWGGNVGKGCTSPIIVGGKLYVMGWTGDATTEKGDDTLRCLDARSGRELWKQSYSSPYQGRKRLGDERLYGGPCSTPSFDLVTGSLFTLSVDGDLRCWDATQQGKLVWAKSLYDEYDVPQRPFTGKEIRDYGYACSPLVLGDSVVVEVGASQGTVMAFDKRTGRQQWASKYNREFGSTAGPVPLQVDGNDCVAVFTTNDVVVIRTDKGHEGETVAAQPWTTDFACHVASPGVSGSRVLITSTHNHREAVLFDVFQGGMRQVWRSSRYAVVSSPVVYRDRVFLIQNQLQCLDLATGADKWRGGGFGNGSCLVTGDAKVIAFGNGKLALIDALADEYRELSQVEGVVGGTCYPHVPLAAGLLVCKDKEGELVCFSVK